MVILGPTTCSSSSSTSPARGRQCRGRRRRRVFRRHRRPRQQRRQLLRRILREIPADDFRAQIETNLFGPVNITPAVLPVMRGQRSGLIVTISSTGGISGQAFVSAYSAAKFGVEGWMELLAAEVVPFGIRTMLVEPGFFRTELLTDESTKWPEATIEDYAENTRQTVSAWKRMNGLQGGDPAKLASADRTRGQPDPPPGRPAGADAVETFEKKARELLDQANGQPGDLIAGARRHQTGMSRYRRMIELSRVGRAGQF